MRQALYVEFGDVQGLKAAVSATRAAKIEIIDAFTPFPVEGLGASLGGSRDGRRVRAFMLVGGLLAAAFAYGLELFSATTAYPFDVGGRPHNSWPTFMMFPFEFGILSAAIFGLIGLFSVTGLPRLHDRHFDIEGFDRVSQDRFALAFARPESKRERNRIEEKLSALGALNICEVDL